MAQRRPFDHQRQNRSARVPTIVKPIVTALPKVEPKRYGKPFVLLEDTAKQTFEFQNGAWVPYGRSIAECRTDCQVTQLAQKVNNMTRYQVCLPL